jgi:hypothetical protein
MTILKGLGPLGALAFALASPLFLAACDDAHFDAGPMRTETRAVSSFNSIDMEGDGRLQIAVGSPESLTIEGRDAILKGVQAEVRDGTLFIKSKRKDWILAGGHQRIALRITVPSLVSLQLDGGNDVRLTGFDGGESNIKIQGATRIEADGTLEELTIHMAGAGHADFSRLVTNQAKVTVDGVGSVYVNSKDSLDATMNGIGSITYSGNPHQVNTSMNGLGSISQRRPRHAERDERHERRDRHPQVDPDSLQPEYDKDSGKDRKKQPKVPEGGMTEVI